MNRSLLFVALTGYFISTLSLPVAGQALPAKTAIDDYVAKPDDSFRWKVVRSEQQGGLKTVVIDMVSQTWRTPDEVDRTEWQHWLTLCVPAEVRSDCGFLFIGGGGNGGDPPSRAEQEVQQMAMATGTVVAQLRMVPNQTLVFHGDGRRRSEDDLIGYTWDQFLKTGDATWPARNPMVKSAVRAMDTVTAYMASAEGGEREVNRFVVAGGSKRGWTTWLTGAVDSRVVGIVPIVIDVLNTNESMRHHFASYGYWAPAVGNYVQHAIMQRMDHPRLRELYQLVDPYFYRHRLKMPKLVLNSAGDQFFLPDSSKFYWDDLEGPKYLRYVPNSDHGLGGTDALESALAFYSLVLLGRDGPQYSWRVDDGRLMVESETPVREVRVWSATNPHARDFRLETLGPKYQSRKLQPNAEGKYVVDLVEPATGWSAYFAELTFDVGAPVPLKLTTSVQVVPDVEPFASKSPTLPPTVTVCCTAPNGVPADTLAAGIRQLVAAGAFPAKELQIETVGTRCYINWNPAVDEFQQQAVGLSQWLQGKGCTELRYQLESGSGPTFDPVGVLEATGN